VLSGPVHRTEKKLITGLDHDQFYEDYSYGPSQFKGGLVIGLGACRYLNELQKTSSNQSRDLHRFHVPIQVTGTGTYRYGYGYLSSDPWTHGPTIVQGNTNNNTTSHNSTITKNCTVAEFHQKTEIEKKIQRYVNLTACLLLTVLVNPSRACGNLRRLQQP
jgi:hypothetical protein